MPNRVRGVVMRLMGLKQGICVPDYINFEQQSIHIMNETVIGDQFRELQTENYLKETFVKYLITFFLKSRSQIIGS